MKQGSDGQPYGLWMMVLSKKIPDKGPMDNSRFKTNQPTNDKGVWEVEGKR